MADDEGWRIIGKAEGGPPRHAGDDPAPPSPEPPAAPPPKPGGGQEAPPRAPPRPARSTGTDRDRRTAVFAVVTVVVLAVSALVVVLVALQPSEPVALDETVAGIALGVFQGVIPASTGANGLHAALDGLEGELAPMNGIEIAMPADSVAVGTAVNCAWSEPERMPDGLVQASTLFHYTDAEDPADWETVSGPWHNVTTITLPVGEGFDVRDVVALAYDAATRDWTPASIAQADATAGKVSVQIGRPTAVVLAAPGSTATPGMTVVEGFPQPAADLAEAVAMVTYTAWRAEHGAVGDTPDVTSLVQAQRPYIDAARPLESGSGADLVARIDALLGGGAPVPLWLGGPEGAAASAHMVLATGRDDAGLRVYDPDVPGQALVIPVRADGGLGPLRGFTEYAISSYVAFGGQALYAGPAEAARHAARITVTLEIDQPRFYDLDLYVVAPDGTVAWRAGTGFNGTLTVTDPVQTFRIGGAAGAVQAGTYSVWVHYWHDSGNDVRDPGDGVVTIDDGGTIRRHPFEIETATPGGTSPTARGTPDDPGLGWAFIADVAA